MIKHCIMIKLKDHSEESKQAAKKMLLSMDGKVNMMRDFEVHTDFLGTERSYDIFLSCVLSDEKALEEYQNDPYHCAIKVYIKMVAESTIAVDAYI